MKIRKEKFLTKQECEALLVEVLQKYYRTTVAMNVKSSLQVHALLKQTAEEMGVTFLECWQEKQLTVTFHFENGSVWFQCQIGEF